MFNIEQIEVIKGPSSTDVGRTAPTGYINLITKKPRLEDSFAGSLSVGSGDFKRSTIDWNKAFTAADGSGLAFRLNTMVEDAGVAGRDYVHNARWGIAPSFAFGLNTPTRMFLDYVHIKQNNLPDGGVPTIGLPGYSNPDGVAPGARRRTFLNFAQPVDPSNFYGTTSDFDRVTSNMLTARVEHDFSPDLTLRNTTRYGKTSQDYMLTSYRLAGFTASAAGLPVTPAANAGFLATPNPLNPLSWTIRRELPTHKDQDNTIFVNQTNVSAKFDTGSIKHSLAAGVELMREEQQNRNFFALGFAGIGTTFAPIGSWPDNLLYAPKPNVVGYNRVHNGTGSEGTTDTVGIYAFDTMKLNEQWQITGGLRLDHYRTKFSSTALTLPSFLVTPTSLKTSGNLWSGKLGVVYKLAENGSIYAAYGTGAQPPGGNNFQLATSGNSANRIDFKPQKAATVEVGTKWDVLHKHLSLTAALFRTEVRNEVVPTDSTSTAFVQTGKKRVQGLELGVSGTLASNWGVSAGYTTMSAKVLGGISVAADGSSVLGYTPKHAFTLWTTYQLPFGLTGGGGARYIGKLARGADTQVGTPPYTEGYWVLDAFASYRISKNIDLQLNLYNLTDREYVAGINKSGFRYTPGVPRSGRLTANFAF